MALGLYMDVHIPAAVTDGLRLRGVDVITSQDDGTRESSDEELLERANELQRILVTQDDDLLTIAAAWQAAERPFVGIAYAHQLGPSIGQLIEDLELISMCADAAEIKSVVTYLPLRS